MLNVKAPDEVLEIISKLPEKLNKHKLSLPFKSETLKTSDAIGRILAVDIVASEDVPGFDRSTVDGYAVRASDTFGCSESIPAVLSLVGEVLMGESASDMFGADSVLAVGSCAAVSTGGELPYGADAVVMVEFSEDYGSGMIGVFKPVAPGNNTIFRGDDVSADDVVLSAGTELKPGDIGILSALGYTSVDVRRRQLVGVISTGDEIVDVSIKPRSGQVRDINTSLLISAVSSFGAIAEDFGIIRDDEEAIRSSVRLAVENCDIVLISGGSSAGARDMTARVIESEGELLLHGIAMKPGKPTILGVVGGKPVFGLPGHPVAAYLVTELFVRPLIAEFMGAELKRSSTRAKLGEAVSANHGRAEYIAVCLDEGIAVPVRGKSGLISSLTGVDGYICIPRDCEGLAKDTEVVVTYF